MDVPGGQVGQRAAAVVVVLDAHRTGFARRQGGVAAAPGLDRGLLIGADHIVVAPSGRPSQIPAYRSSTRAALAAKPGSRTEIQDRCCQGLRASRASHRRIVDAETAMPQRAASSRARSGPLHLRQRHPGLGGQRARQRDGLGPVRGGEHRRAAAARGIGQPGQPALGEPAAPLAHRVSAHPQLPGDRGVGLAGRCGEHDRCPQPVAVRPAHRPGPGRQHGLFPAGQDNLVWASHRHAFFMPYPRQCPAPHAMAEAARRR